MIFHSLLVLAMVSAVIAGVSFILFVRARMKENKKAEQLYQSLHFIALIIFVVIGIVILVMMSNRPDA